MSNKKTAQTTAADFAVFCESVEFYMELLHLGEWKHLCHHDDEGLEDSFASYQANHPGRLVEFTLAKTIPKGLIVHCNPWLQGKHEVCELLLSELVRSCKVMFNANEVNAWTHAIIRRLERALPGKGGKKI